jgi:glycosyltransferase involved in cell wall biosynthesis
MTDVTAPPLAPASYPEYDVVALGARDYYEAAVALKKANRLHKLYTDWYTPDRLRSLLKKRFNEALPSRATRSFPLFALLNTQTAGDNRARRFLGFCVNYAFGFLSAAANYFFGPRRALVYSYYIEGFAGFYKLARRRPRHLVCFVVQPAPKFVQEAMARDREAYAAIGPARFVSEPEEGYNPRALGRFGRALRFCDEIVCASRITRESILDEAGGTKISVLPYGSRFPVRERPAAEFERGGKIKLISVCQVVERKGLHWAFYAMSQLAGEVQDAFDWLVIGERRDPVIATLAPKNVRFEDAMPGGQLFPHLTQADLFVMPSILEGFGLVYIESLSAGTPVVYTATTGAADFCVSGVHGYSVRPSNWQDIAEVFARCASAPDELRLLRPRCLDLARSVNWERFHDGILNVCASRSEPQQSRL